MTIIGNGKVFGILSGVKVGPGGWHCFCCGPETAGDKRRLRRQHRRITKQNDRKLRNEDLYLVECRPLLREDS